MFEIRSGYMFQDMSKDFDIKRIKRSNTSCSTGVGAHVHPFNEIFYLSSGALLTTTFISSERVILLLFQADVFTGQLIMEKECMKELL